MTDKITRKEMMDRGLWSSNDVGDPTTDRYAAAILLSRLQIKSLAPGASFNVTGAPGVAGISKAGVHTITIAYSGNHYPALALGNTYCDAVCQAVQTLSSFLTNYPECAAIQDKAGATK